MAIRVRQRLEKDIRSAARGRSISKLRIKEARRQGHEIPTLEEAMRNVRLMEEEARRRDESEGKKEEPIEQTQTNRERKREEREKVGEARKEAARKLATS